MGNSIASAPGLPSWNTVSQHWNAADTALIAGIAAYRRHPYVRAVTDPPTIWAEGDSRLLDYGVPGHTKPILFVPSLVNRAYILDLMTNHSCLRWMAAQGLRPILLDWGWPTEAERRFGLTDYIAGRLERAILSIGQPVILAGYCMGGLLAVAAALRLPEKVKALALLATPWDFHQPDPNVAHVLGQALPALEPVLQFSGTVPVDILQTWFASTDASGIARKYRGFARLPQDADRTRLFVAIEDWLNDGVPLPAPVARECLNGWYRQNLPARGEWQVAGMPVDPRALSLPCFIAIPERDRVVPPESALALAARMPQATLHRPGTGHIGMLAGPRAETALWRPLCDWLCAISG